MLSLCFRNWPFGLQEIKVTLFGYIVFRGMWSVSCLFLLSYLPDILPPFTTVGIYRQTCLILYTNGRLFPRLSQQCPLLYGICHCTEHNHFPTIVILSSSEQEKHSSGSGKLFFFLPPIFVFAFLRSYISIASLQYNSVTSVYRNILSFIFLFVWENSRKVLNIFVNDHGQGDVFFRYFFKCFVDRASYCNLR